MIISSPDKHAATLATFGLAKPGVECTAFLGTQSKRSAYAIIQDTSEKGSSGQTDVA